MNGETPAYPYVVFAESNIKGGVRCALGPKTLLVGDNGTGKSAVVNTVELATTGRVSDVRGRREVALVNDLMELGPGGKVELLARVMLSTGDDCVWRAGGKKKSAVHTFPNKIVAPDTVLPLRPVYDAVLGNVETARKFFLQYAVGVVSDKDVLARIPESLHAYYKRATLKTTLSTGSAVDRLLVVLEHSKQQAREAKAAAKAAAAVSVDNAQGLAPLPTEAEEQALADAVKSARAKLDGMKRILTQREAVETATKEQADLQAKLKEAELAYGAARAETAAAKAALDALPVPQGASEEMRALRAVIVVHGSMNAATCECCGMSVGEALATHGMTRTPQALWRERLAALDAWLATQADAVAVYEAAKSRHATAMLREQQALNAGKVLWERAEAVNAVLTNVPTEAPTPAMIVEVEQIIATLEGKQREVDVLKASWATVSKGKDSAGDAAKNAETWEKLTEACVEAVGLLLDNGITAFQTKVQAHLIEQDRFALVLRDGDKQTFRFGLKKNSVLSTALSGAEWARVMAAFAAVCRDPSPTKLAVVIPPPGEFSARTLHDVLVAFTDVKAQVLIASPVFIDAPAKWMVVNTDAGEHTNGAPIPLPPVGFETPAVPQE